MHIEFSPRERGAGFEFEDRIRGGAIPRQYLPAVEKGLVECFASGSLAGFPVVDIKAAAFDGQYHDVDSSDESFRNAARLAVEDGYHQASPVILEPIVKLAIEIPDLNTGDVIGDISARPRARAGHDPADYDGATIVEVEGPRRRCSAMPPTCARSRRDGAVHQRIRALPGSAAARAGSPRRRGGAADG